MKILAILAAVVALGYAAYAAYRSYKNRSAAPTVTLAVPVKAAPQPDKSPKP